MEAIGINFNYDKRNQTVMQINLTVVFHKLIILINQSLIKINVLIKGIALECIC